MVGKANELTVLPFLTRCCCSWLVRLAPAMFIADAEGARSGHALSGKRSGQRGARERESELELSPGVRSSFFLSSSFFFDLVLTSTQASHSPYRPTTTTHRHLPPAFQVKKAIEKGNIDGAKIYAQNAIRKKTEALNYLRLASRLDAVVSRLETQAKMQGVARSMGGIVKALDRALATNNIEKVAETMDAFEKQFENLDVQSQVMEGAMSAQASLATPEEDVATLLQQVADEHGLEVQLNLPQAGAQVRWSFSFAFLFFFCSL